jgi:HlyD family secretion protein
MSIPKQIYFFICVFLSLICLSCSRNPNHLLQGYIEGEYIYISSKSSSVITDLNVVRGQQVKKGDLLFHLEAEPEVYDVDAAKAEAQQLQAELDFTKIQFKRQKLLYPKGATDESTVDQSERDFESKAKQLQATLVDLKKAEWNLARKSFFAPIDSQVVDTYYRIGERVSVNQPILSLLSPTYIHVLFYIPEPLLSQIRIGQTISFTCDGCKSETNAVINYISPEAEYTPPIIYSKDTRYKLVYLVRAQMPPDIAKQFHPGQPVDILLHD